jgi:putative membrane protein
MFFIKLWIKGGVMGIADAIPGVSGGTVALVLGIYKELIDSIARCNIFAVKLLINDGIIPFWKYINGSFLITVFSGILISLKCFSSIISLGLSLYPLLIFGFFSGLIVGSSIIMIKILDCYKFQQFVFFLLGMTLVMLIPIASSVQPIVEWWMLVIAGFIAISAMILPGISGSLILVILGFYKIFIEAIANLDILVLMSFGAGSILGALTFSRFLSWLLHTYYKNTMALLIGFLLGSIKFTWPWKHDAGYDSFDNIKDIATMQVNVLPSTFSEITSQNNELFLVLLLFTVALVFVLFLKSQTKGEKI